MGGRTDGAGLTAYRTAVSDLAVAQKSGRGAPPYSRWVNRRVGRWLAAAAHLRGATPNEVTCVSAVFTFSGIALLTVVRPHWWLGLVVAVLLLTGYALDSADGQLARLRGGGSPSGEWLDHMVDAVKMAVVHSCVLVSFYRFGDDHHGWHLLVPLVYQAASSIFFFGFIFIDHLRRGRVAAGLSHRRPDASGMAQTLAALPTDYGIVCLVFLVFGWAHGFFVVYTLMCAATSFVVSGAIARWWHEVRAWD